MVDRQLSLRRDVLKGIAMTPLEELGIKIEGTYSFSFLIGDKWHGRDELIELLTRATLQVIEVTTPGDSAIDADLMEDRT